MMNAPRHSHLPSRMDRRHCLRAAGGLLVGPVLNLGPLAGCTLATAPRAAPADYASAMRQAVQTVTGELPDYRFRPTPVGGFGVGSIYLDEVTQGRPADAESGWFLGGPDSWLARSLPPAERQHWLERLVTEASAGAIRFDSATSRELQLQAGLALLGYLAGEASIDNRQALQTQLRADDLRHRRLNWAQWQEAQRAGLISREIAERVQRGGFIVAAADVVLSGFSAEIAVDDVASPALIARLRAKALLPARVGATGSLRISEAARGRFVVTSSQPVVAAVLFKRPPPSTKNRAAPAPAELMAWPDAAVNESALSATEGRALRERGAP